MEKGTLSNQSFITAPTAGRYEYLLVAQPDATVYAQVMAEKQFFTAQFEAPVAVKTKPHITIADFMAMEPMEETIIRWMHRVISTKKSFRVTLDEFGAFRPHTIYLKIRDHQPFQQIAGELKVIDQYVKSYGCPSVQLVTNPHLTIARQLAETTYRRAAAVYAAKSFHASFDVTELLLLRRQHPFDSCKQINVFSLQP